MVSTYRIQGATGEWEVVIGLEVHAQVTSNAKLFSGASTAFGAEPNSQVSLAGLQAAPADRPDRRDGSLASSFAAGFVDDLDPELGGFLELAARWPRAWAVPAGNR